MSFTPEDYVFYSNKDNIHGGGVPINSLFTKNKISAIAPVQQGGEKNIHERFKDLAIPMGLLYLEGGTNPAMNRIIRKQTMSGGGGDSYSDNQICEEHIYNKLIGGAEEISKHFKANTTRSKRHKGGDLKSRKGTRKQH